MQILLLQCYGCCSLVLFFVNTNIQANGHGHIEYFVVWVYQVKYFLIEADFFSFKLL